MLVSRYFLPPSHLSRIPSNTGLVSNLSTLLRRRHYCKFLQLCIISYYYFRHSQTLAEILSYLLRHSPSNSILAIIRKKLHGFSIFLLTLVCKLAFLMSIAIWRDGKILPLVCGFIWFWCAWRSAKHFDPKYNFIVYCICHEIAFETIIYIKNYLLLQASVSIALWLVCRQILI